VVPPSSSGEKIRMAEANTSPAIDAPVTACWRAGSKIFDVDLMTSDVERGRNSAFTAIAYISAQEKIQGGESIALPATAITHVEEIV
jgi:hypothetical protein